MEDVRRKALKKYIYRREEKEICLKKKKKRDKNYCLIIRHFLRTPTKAKAVCLFAKSRLDTFPTGFERFL